MRTLQKPIQKPIQVQEDTKKDTIEDTKEDKDVKEDTQPGNQDNHEEVQEIDVRHRPSPPYPWETMRKLAIQKNIRWYDNENKLCHCHAASTQTQCRIKHGNDGVCHKHRPILINE